MGLRDSIQEWAKSKVVGPELYNAYQAALEMLDEMQQWRPLVIRDRIAALSETDARYRDLMRRMSGGYGVVNAKPTETERLAAVAESRDLVHTDPTAERAVDAWTDFGFGHSISITYPQDESASEVFQEFWSSRRNRGVLGEARLQQVCRQLLMDGEFFFLFFFSRMDGRATIRVLSTEQITEIIAVPSDAMIPLLYKRTVTTAPPASVQFAEKEPALSTLYYKDWLAPDADLRDALLPKGSGFADERDQKTDVRLMHVAFNQSRADDVRGWPLVKTAAAWMRAYHTFLENRLAVSRAVAAFVDKIVNKGGSLPLQGLRNQLDARLRSAENLINRKEPVAATWLENTASTRSRMPLTTGGGDAQKDGGTVLSQAGVGVALPPNFLGRPDMMQNKSVADVSLLPTMAAFERFQLLWSSVWRDVSDCVLAYWSKYNPEQESLVGIEPEISTDVLLRITEEQIEAAMQVLVDMVAIGVETSQLEKSAAYLLRLTMQFLGARNVDLLVPSALKFTDSEESEEPEDPMESEDDETMNTALQTVARNYADGLIDVEQLADCVIATVVELRAADVST